MLQLFNMSDRLIQQLNCIAGAGRRMPAVLRCEVLGAEKPFLAAPASHAAGGFLSLRIITAELPFLAKAAGARLLVTSQACRGGSSHADHWKHPGRPILTNQLPNCGADRSSFAGMR